MTDMIEYVALAIEATMFAPHELPLDAELHAKYRETADAAIKAMDQWRFKAAGIGNPQSSRKSEHGKAPT